MWAAADDSPASGSPARPVYVLGVHTTTNTAEAAVSRSSERAARLAVAEHNATPKRAYDLKVKVLADRGDVDTAREVARTFTADRTVVAVLGPVAEIPMRAAAAVYGEAGLTHLSTSTGQQDYFLTSPKTSFQSGPAHGALGGCLTSRKGKDFTAAWQKRYGDTPESYATEAYDGARMLLTEFSRTVPAGARRSPVRTALAARLAKVKYAGVARTYTFGEFHHYDTSGEGWAANTFVHQVHDGHFRQLGSLAGLEAETKAQG